ncbi:MAG: hypothetical protein ACRDRX_24865 [Pseudonocardiaceae bacterium]
MRSCVSARRECIELIISTAQLVTGVALPGDQLDGPVHAGPGGGGSEVDLSELLLGVAEQEFGVPDVTLGGVGEREVGGQCRGSGRGYLVGSLGDGLADPHQPQGLVGVLQVQRLLCHDHAEVPGKVSGDGVLRALGDFQAGQKQPSGDLLLFQIETHPPGL